jgi:hypothetical protein
MSLRLEELQYGKEVAVLYMFRILSTNYNSLHNTGRIKQGTKILTGEGRERNKYNRKQNYRQYNLFIIDKFRGNAKNPMRTLTLGKAHRRAIHRKVETPQKKKLKRQCIKVLS